MFTLRERVVVSVERSLAFTALLELYPGFGQLTQDEGSALVSELVAGWRTAGRPVLWEYARTWVAGRTAGESAVVTSTCGGCRRQLFKVANPGPSGAWYHTHNGSVACYPGDGSGRKAMPVSV